ncbi:MAG: competence protein ComEA [Gammaproteobacteria bacterium]|nr:competence protein ComEA [Gammaproteobacteria bacterium]|tara:strand:- start:718 stop:1065 length:348 start_codon:yes stop_codon:yes gene_type:complete
MQTATRYIKLSFKSFLFCLATCTAVFSVSVGASAQESPASTEIVVEQQVNINTADAETLALALDGVGMTRAMDIIAYREQNGEFETVEQLQEVSGIGPATLERNRARILLSDSTE